MGDQSVHPLGVRAVKRTTSSRKLGGAVAARPSLRLAAGMPRRGGPASGWRKPMGLRTTGVRCQYPPVGAVGARRSTYPEAPPPSTPATGSESHTAPGTAGEHGEKGTNALLRRSGTRDQPALSRIERTVMNTRWIYPSEGPNGEFGATYRKYGFGSFHLAKECEQVEHIPTGKLV